nr:hypothetical protein [Tanacetum cinerariifolium]
GYGKMGHTLADLAPAHGHEVVGIVDQHASTQRIEDFTPAAADVAIEFTHPESAFENVKACLRQGLPVVCGSTGWLHHFDEAKALCENLGYWVNFQRRLYLEYLHAYDNVSTNAIPLRAPSLGNRASREISLNNLYAGVTGARHYLDLSLLVFAAGYSLQILDAVVDANLHDFDVGRNLSLQWQPTLLPIPGQAMPAAGATVALHVK